MRKLRGKIGAKRLLGSSRSEIRAPDLDLGALGVEASLGVGAPLGVRALGVGIG